MKKTTTTRTNDPNAHAASLSGATFTATPPMKRFVRLPQVLHAVGVAERTLYDLMRRGDFPRPAKIGKMSVWVEEEIEAWQQARLSSRHDQFN